MPVRSIIWFSFVFALNIQRNPVETTELNLIECVRMIRDNISSIETQSTLKSKCETRGCIKIAARIVSDIDESIDPCENFYQFANGRYINDLSNSFDIERDQSRSLYSTVSDLMSNKVGILLSEPAKINEWNPFLLAKDFYKSCLNRTSSLNEPSSSRQYLIDIIKSLDGWPFVALVKGRHYNLVDFMARISPLGLKTDSILTVDVVDDPIYATKKLLRITSGNYQTVDFDNEEEVKIYRNSLFSCAEYFINYGNNVKWKRAVYKQLDRILAFERNLIKISSGNYEEENDADVEVNEEENDADVQVNEEENDADVEVYEATNDTDFEVDKEENTTETTTIKDFQESYPYLNWFDYINVILPAGLNVTENEPILNDNPQFFEKLDTLLNSTSMHTVFSYILSRAIYDIIPDNSGESLPKECVSLTAKRFPIPVGLLYSSEYLNETARLRAVNFVDDVRQAFIDTLREADWMDDETRKYAIKKAEKMVAHVGYSNELYGNDGLEEHYQGLEIKTDNFYSNSMRCNLFDKTQMFRSLRKPPVNRSGWEELLDLNPIEANAENSVSRNAMIFPVAILHELFFSVDSPQYINYARLGSIIGHEIIHGFDIDNYKYDVDGNLMNWWNSETEKIFKKKAECFVDQYSNYTDSRTNLTLDGNNTLGENISDNGGIRAAYLAYQKWIARNGLERIVPGVECNQNQLFWIAYAQTEGSIESDSYLTHIISNDPHAPDEFRVNGVVSNMQEFANDFNCPVDSKMNPVNKCRVW